MKRIVFLLLIVSGLFAQKFTLLSTAFNNGDVIPIKYTCKGKDVSPPLHWKYAPKGTKTFAIIMEDPDAPGGTWIHWVIYNIPANYSRLQEAIPQGRELKGGMIQALNSWEKFGYGGPCPPSGTHRYFFRIYALKDRLPDNIETKEDLIRKMEPLILGQAILMGKFSK